MADGKVVIDVLLDGDKVDKGISKINGRLHGLTSASNKAQLTVGKLASALGLVVLARKGIQLVGSSIQTAFRRIDTMEQFERVMTTMTGSVEAANKILDQTNEAVLGTAYGLDVAALAVQNFTTSNMEVEKATETLAAWGDAVAFYGDGSNDTLASVSDALAKMSAKGKVQMDTMNRLTERGIPAMQIYADATGMSVEEVSNLMSNGALTTENFIDVMNKAFKEGTKGFASIDNAAKEAGASWSGSFANMRAAIARGVVSILSATDEILADNGIPDMRTLIGKFGKSFENALKSVASQLPKAVDKVKEFYNELKPWLPLIRNVAIAVGILLTTIATVNTALKTLTGVMRTLNMVFAMSPIGMLITAITLLTGAFIHLWKTNDDFRGFFIETWEKIKSFTIRVWESISDFIMPAVNAIVSFAMEIWGMFTDFWEEHGQMVMEATQNVWNAISVAVEWAIEKIWGIMQFIWPVIEFLIIDTWNAIKNVIQGAVDVILGIVQFFSALFTGNWEEMWEAVKRIFTGALQFVWGLINLWFLGRILKLGKTFVGFFKGIFTGMWNFIRNLFTRSGAAVANAVSNIFSKMVGFIRTPVNAIKNIIQNGLKGALNVVKNMATSFFNAGRNIVSSIADGIKGAVGKVTGAIGGVAKKIRGFLPFSPAEEGALRDIHRLDFGGTIAEGINKGKSKAINAISGLTEDMMDLMNPEDLSVAKMVGVTHEFNTIPSVTNNNKAEKSNTRRLKGSDEDNVKQPAIVNVYVGSKKVAEEVVDDITRLQERKENRNNRNRR